MHADLATASLRRFGALRLRATGGSMLPAIAAGDVLSFRHPARAELQPGQVTLVVRQGRLYIHRIVELRADGSVVTRGDALTCNDPAVPPEAVLGILDTQQRDGRTVDFHARHATRRQRLARGLIRRFTLLHRLFSRFHRLAHAAA